MKITPLTENDMSGITALQPVGWNDITPHIYFYIQSHFCFPLKALEDDRLVGIGTAILHGSTAWLAHIIVHPEYRNRGIGHHITQALIGQLRNTPCETILLLATEQGKPVYEKSGFQTETTYVFLKGGAIEPQPSSCIVPFDHSFREALLTMDHQVSGEDRSRLIIPALESARLFVKDNALLGYYIPALGDGMIVANIIAAGVALQSIRSSREPRFSLPADNAAGVIFLKQHHYLEYATGYRMTLGKKLRWDPTQIYNRIGGNFG